MHQSKPLFLLLLLCLCSFSGNNNLIITSTAFNNNGFIPPLYSCEGENISPPLHIENIPKKTETLAIIMHDPDAPIDGGFTHWVLWNIPPMNDIIKKYDGGSKGLNSAQTKGYTGMCPPSGTHHYNFTVYALDSRLSLPPGTNKALLEKAMEEHILARGSITGLYKKIN